MIFEDFGLKREPKKSLKANSKNDFQKYCDALKDMLAINHFQKVKIIIIEKKSETTDQ
jgi:regulator of sigma D